MSFKNNIVVLVTVCLSYQTMAQMTTDELKAKYANYVLECSTEHSVGAADIKELFETSNPQKENVKCMLACTLKKTGMTDDEGKLSVEGVRKVAALVYTDKPKLMEKTEQLLETCKSVNDEEVSGKKECERAALIIKCITQQT